VRLSARPPTRREAGWDGRGLEHAALFHAGLGVADEREELVDAEVAAVVRAREAVQFLHDVDRGGGPEACPPRRRPVCPRRLFAAAERDRGKHRVALASTPVPRARRAASREPGVVGAKHIMSLHAW